MGSIDGVGDDLHKVFRRIEGHSVAGSFDSMRADY